MSTDVYEAELEINLIAVSPSPVPSPSSSFTVLHISNYSFNFLLFSLQLPFLCFRLFFLSPFMCLHSSSHLLCLSTISHFSFNFRFWILYFLFSFLSFPISQLSYSPLSYLLSWPHSCTFSASEISVCNYEMLYTQQNSVTMLSCRCIFIAQKLSLSPRLRNYSTCFVKHSSY
jgi:hypothetical protein